MNKKEVEKEIKEKIEIRNIVDEMKESYLDYSMSVITARALPDVRDGLKPVHRRILYTMYEMNLLPGGRFRKSAAVVGEVLGKFHPHGDAAVYESMVNMAQDFSFRYPLIAGQGNFGSIDGDSPAAMRYTEVKMARITPLMLKDIEKNTVDWRLNYDATRKEPQVLPAAIPNLLLNGTLGIAVGMATNFPPHNLKEVIEATIYFINHPNASTADLLQFIKGPDFPTGGIIYGGKDLNAIYSSGRGGIVVRGEAEIIEQKSGNYQIIITSIPYRVNKSDLIVSIANLVQEKKIEGIKDIRDESTSDVRIVIDLKSNAFPEKILNYIYKHTSLENNFHFNMVALVDGIPRTLSLKSYLSNFIEFRKEIVKRAAEFDLAKALEREHILIGLKKALDFIDKVIKIIRASKDPQTAKKNLMKEFKFSEVQATAILETKLQKLSNLERKSVEEELKEKQILIKELRELLKNPKKILEKIAKELKEIADKFGDERKTKVVKSEVKEFKPEDLIPEKEVLLVFTSGGYIKLTDPSEYKVQKRGGVGVIEVEPKEEDFVTHLVSGNTHDDVLFFTNLGKVYQLKMYDVPEGKRTTKGKSIMNFLSLASDEKITSILPIPKNIQKEKAVMILVTKNGISKKVLAESFKDVRRSGIYAISLENGDELKSASFVEKGDQVILVSAKGQSICFKESDVRIMGRNAGGVKVMRLSKDDKIVGVSVFKPKFDGYLLTVSENGFAKKTKTKEFKIQRRGGSGIKAAKINIKTGDLIEGRVVSSENYLLAISKKGQIIKIPLESISYLGRQTQGVRIMKLRPGDSLASVTTL